MTQIFEVLLNMGIPLLQTSAFSLCSFQPIDGNVYTSQKKIGICLHWLENQHCLEEVNSFNIATAVVAPTFFNKQVLEPFKNGWWRLMGLETLHEADLASLFMPIHFLLSLPGRTFPPWIPLAGYSMQDLRDLFTNIHWFFALVTADLLAIRERQQITFAHSLLAVKLQALENMLSVHCLYSSWPCNQVRCTATVLNFLAQLFGFFWASSALGLQQPSI